MPTGWTGYFELYDNTAGSPGCVDPEWPTSKLTGNDGLNAPAATCNCGNCSVSGETCEPGPGGDPNTPTAIDPVVVWDAPCATYGTDGRCYGAITSTSNWTGTCDYQGTYPASLNNCGTSATQCGASANGSSPCNQSVVAPALQVAGGTCGTPPQPVLVLPTPAWTWTNNAEACGAPTAGTGCAASDHTCLPKPQGAFVGGVCIMQAGVQTCPAGFTGSTHVIYDPTKTTEGRTCSACTCGAITHGDCSATITVDSDPSCASPVVTLKPTTQASDCKALPNNPAVGAIKATFTSVTGGSCAGGGSQSMGSVTAGGATTFCCTQ